MNRPIIFYTICFLLCLIALFVSWVMCMSTPIEPAESSIIFVETLETSETTETSDTTFIPETSKTTSTTFDEESTVLEETTTEEFTVLEETTIKEQSTAATTTSETTTTIIETEDLALIETGVKVCDLELVGIFQGTYYLPIGEQSPGNTLGGSGRVLDDCGIKENVVKGSVACKSVFEKYGYEYNGGRTTVYIDFPNYPEMNGYYHVDDCCAAYGTVDFYFDYESNCPFKGIGRIFDLKVYLAT